MEEASNDFQTGAQRLPSRGLFLGPSTTDEVAVGGSFPCPISSPEFGTFGPDLAGLQHAYWPKLTEGQNIKLAHAPEPSGDVSRDPMLKGGSRGT